ncbi:MAG: hypothetical protein PHC62_00240 [Candidatus Izemoplasmatales bacterium]|nr:hypothetical protein [Candidatus Izemoplasmatales bacterium]
MEGVNLLAQNINNYGIYGELVRAGFMTIYTKDIHNDNLMTHFQWLFNIFRDGIEREQVHAMKVNVVFEDNESVILSIFEYFMNIMFWKAPLSTNDRLTSRFFYWSENFTADDIKEYIDDNLLDIHRENYSNLDLNVIIDDTLELFKANDEFALYYFNTINNEDTLKLMNEDSIFYECTHTDFSNVPLQDVKNIGDQKTNIAIQRIKESNHSLADAFRAKEGINRKQYREYLINIGTVVDGEGGIYPTVINSSFANNGVRNIRDYYMESSKGRQALIISHKNVGTSGAFARILSLNNRDTFLNPNPEYSCRTKNLIPIYIKNEAILDIYKGRYYRFSERGIEYRISSNPIRDNKDLIGKTLLMRSPMTCESAVWGHGICRKCYGDLYFTNREINIGQMASELLSSLLTQRMLSAKHLLESRVITPEFQDIFYNYFGLNFNIIKIKEGIPQPDKYHIVIDCESIFSEDDNDNLSWNDYCTRFSIQLPDGTQHKISLQNEENLYLSKELLLKLDDKHLIDDNYYISFDEMKTDNLFLINMDNDELSKTLKGVTALLNKEESIKNLTKDQFITRLIEVVMDGGINIDAIHLEIILSNQIRKEIIEKEDVLEKPDWGIPNTKYSLITLNKALNANPSVTTTLQYQKFKTNIIDPLMYKKTAPSTMDLVFMEKPQEFTKMRPVRKKIKSDKETIYRPISFADTPD